LLLSEAGANSIYDFGFWYDAEVVNILNEKASDEFVVESHTAFVNAECSMLNAEATNFGFNKLRSNHSAVVMQTSLCTL